MITQQQQPNQRVQRTGAMARRAESEREILALLARGEREIAQGAGHDFSEVLADADRLLAATPAPA